MELLRTDSLSLYRGPTLLLSGLSVTVPLQARIGIIGRSGVGKSTLLQVLANRLPPSDGAITFSPGLRIAYLPQRQTLAATQTVWQVAEAALTDVRTLEAELRALEAQLNSDAALGAYGWLVARFEQAGGYLAEHTLKRLLRDYAISEDLWQLPVATLSGGQQVRLALVTALARQAELLCLDEPTNQLDSDARQVLIGDLQRYPGALIVVSHDRALLDALCHHIWHLEASSVHRHPGDYSSFVRARHEQRRIAHKRQREAARQRQQLERDYQQVKTATSRQKVAQRQSLERKLDALAKTQRTPTPQQQRYQLSAQAPREPLLHVRKLSYAFDQHPLFSDVSFDLAQGDRVVLLGPNGSGKSTLLQLLAGDLEPLTPEAVVQWHPASKVLYLDQQTRGLRDAPILAQLTELVSVPRAESLLSLVRLPSERWQAHPGALSGGERARAAIAQLIASEANVLLLDEPTNDLDLPTIELLEDALMSSAVALMLVTHDQRLAERTATQIWRLEAGQLHGLSGGGAGNHHDPPSLGLWPLDHDAETAPDAVALKQLETERATLDELLSDPWRFGEREFARMRARYRTLTEQLMQRYDAMFPEAAPRYRVTEGPYIVWADKLDGAVTISSNTPANIALKLEAGVCHLILQAPAGSSLTRPTYYRLIDLLTRLAFWYFDASVVQHQSTADLSATVLHRASDGWWLISRGEYEREQGYLRISGTPFGQWRRSRT